MPTTKNALTRYHTLDRCFQNRGKRYDIEALLEECNQSILELDPASDGIKRRQLYEDIKFMESEQGYGVELEKIKEGKRVYYRYEDPNFSIRNLPVNNLEAEQLKAATAVLSRFKGLPQFAWINELLPKLDQAFQLSDGIEGAIEFETNPYLKGLEHIEKIFQAIINKQTLKISYQSFKSLMSMTIYISPYLLKQYNNRWFLFGKNPDYSSLSNLALDRILHIEKSAEEFEEGARNQLEGYFEDIVGVTRPEHLECEKVVLKVNNELLPYIMTKPIHGSQKIKTKTPDHTMIELEVIPNYELERLIMSYGEKIEIKAPEELRLKIKNRIRQTLLEYQ